MKQNIIIAILLTAFVTTVIMVISDYQTEIDELKSENNRLIAQHEARLNNLAVGHAQENTDRSTLAGIIHENEALLKANYELTQNLAETKKSLTLVEEDLDELVKPFYSDILSAALKSNVGHEEVLVTGGYQTADGQYHYAFVEPHTAIMPDGSTAIVLKTQRLSIAPDVLSEFGLDTLVTNTGNTLQHGEIWTSAELKEVTALLSGSSGVEITSVSELIVAQGERARISVGDYQLSTKSKILEDGTGFNIELRIEQARVPEGLLAEEANASQEP